MIEPSCSGNEPTICRTGFEIDRGWEIFSAMTKGASEAVRAEAPNITRVLGGISPIDPNFIRNMEAQGVLKCVDVVAVHGFPLDWNHWNIHEWPERIQAIRAVTKLPIWVSEVGASTFGAEEIQEFGLEKTAALLIGCARIHWYTRRSPRAWARFDPAPESEGSSYSAIFTWAC